MSTRKGSLRPSKATGRRLLWLVVFAVLLVWIVQNPHQARAGVEHVMHALSVLFSGLGGGA